MRVAAVQFKADKDDADGSLARLCEIVRGAAADADLVVLPEMALSGYVFAGVEEVAPWAELPTGRTFTAFSAIAADTQSWIVVGYPERSPQGAYYNSALVISPDGELAFNYRKMLLFEEDLTWAQPGDTGYRVFDTGMPRGRFTVGICMDLNDDNFIQWCAESAVDAVAFPTNWVDEGHSPWGYWAWRMAPTGAVLIAANSYGPDGHTAFTGLSAVLAGRTVYAAAPATGDGVIGVSLLAIPAPDPEVL